MLLRYKIFFQCYIQNATFSGSHLLKMIGVWLYLLCAAIFRLIQRYLWFEAHHGTSGLICSLWAAL